MLQVVDLNFSENHWHDIFPDPAGYVIGKACFFSYVFRITSRNVVTDHPALWVLLELADSRVMGVAVEAAYRHYRRSRSPVGTWLRLLLRGSRRTSVRCWNALSGEPKPQFQGHCQWRYDGVPEEWISAKCRDWGSQMHTPGAESENPDRQRTQPNAKYMVAASSTSPESTLFLVDPHLRIILNVADTFVFYP